MVRSWEGSRWPKHGRPKCTSSFQIPVFLWLCCHSGHEKSHPFYSRTPILMSFLRRKAEIIHCFRSQCTDIWKAIPVFVCINVSRCEILKRKTPWSVYVHVRVLHYGGRRRFITCSFLGALQRSLRPLRVSALKPSSLVAEDTPSASYQTTVTRRLILYDFDPFLRDSENDY